MATCTCNLYCNNQECSAHIFTCSNSYSFTGVSSGLIIDDTHVNQLRSACNGAYLRRSIPYPSWPNYPASGGLVDPVTAARYTTSKNNINALHAGLVTQTFSAGNIIYASYTTALQNDTNTVRNECVCNYNCTCNINCGCNTADCLCNYHPNQIRRIQNNG